MPLLWVVPLGLLVGLALGTLGGGGSILTVPALVYLLGQSPAAATTGSLVIVGLTSIAGAIPHYRRGNVRLAKGVAFGLVGIGGSVLGSKLAAGLRPDVLLSAFAVLMLVVAVLMALRLRRRGSSAATGTEEMRVVPLILTATGVGLLTGFFGVGGGFAVVPALTLALGLSMPVAVGTSLVVIALNSASAFVARLGSGVAFDPTVVLAFAVVAAVGSVLGARLSHRLSHRTLTLAFVVMLVVVAGYMAATNIPSLFR